MWLLTWACIEFCPTNETITDTFKTKRECELTAKTLIKAMVGATEDTKFKWSCKEKKR